MEKCVRRFIVGDPAMHREALCVVDVGAADVNGSYRALFEPFSPRYIGVDLAPGPGVDVVLRDAYRLPLPDASADVVLSGQMLEHCEYFWRAFEEMYRILHPDGYLFLIAPSAGPEHRYPVDCYRFYPDAFRTLAAMTQCRLVEVWLDERGPWRDLVGVFAKHRRNAPEKHWRHLPIDTAPTDVAEGTPAQERVSGLEPTHAVLARLHADTAPRGYLEIGVRHGASLTLASCPAIGVDPAPELDRQLGNNCRIVEATSDEFFENDATVVPQPLDLAFIDGMHLFEFALRDFMNVERHAHSGTIVVLDDIFPNHPDQAERERRTRVWTGDVWKMASCLEMHRPDLLLIPLDTAPTGLLLVANLNPLNRTLWDGYNPIVRQFRNDMNVPPPAEILTRTRAVAPKSAIVERFTAAVRAVRGTGVTLLKAIGETHDARF
jgi:hypothetical protein